jgi:pteridine reductase
MARRLHAEGVNLTIHYRRSEQAARRLQTQLEEERPDSVQLLAGDLLRRDTPSRLVERSRRHWGRLDGLINNASSFYPTALGEITEDDWTDLLGTNLKAPLFLSQAAAPHLRQHRGSIINLVDIHAEQPLKGYMVYSMAKAGLVMLTKSLARELGPEVRVNAVAPGAVLWPEQGVSAKAKETIVRRTALKRPGDPADVANAVIYLLRDADYVTGQVLVVDGGRSLGY